VVGDCQVAEHLLHKNSDVLPVHEHVDQLERSPADRDVRVLEAIDDRVAVPLDRAGVSRYDLRQRAQRDVSAFTFSSVQKYNEWSEVLEGHVNIES
jgi:hypothetical protein